MSELALANLVVRQAAAETYLFARSTWRMSVTYAACAWAHNCKHGLIYVWSRNSGKGENLIRSVREGGRII